MHPLKESNEVFDLNIMDWSTREAMNERNKVSKSYYMKAMEPDTVRIAGKTGKCDAG